MQTLSVKTDRRTQLVDVTAEVQKAVMATGVANGVCHLYVPHTTDSHVKAVLVGTSQSVFVERGKLVLGRWQGVFFCEFDGPRDRQLHVKVVAD